MHQPWRAIPILTLLSLSSLVHPTPTPYGNALALPKDLQPVLQDDQLPDGNPKDAVQVSDFDISLDDLKDCPDFDPDQGGAGSKSRLLKRGTRSGTTTVLRICPPISALSLSSRKELEARRILSNRSKPPKNFHKFLASRDIYSGRLIMSAIWESLARVDTPPNIKAAAWTKVQDGIFGEQPSNGGDPKANDDTKTLSRMLRPAGFLQKVHRSAAWGAYRHMIKTKSQFDETLKKVSEAIKGFIKDDDDSAKAIEKYFNDGGQKLKNPLLDDPKKSIFKADDCSNTADSPDDPNAKTNNVPPPPAPTHTTPSPASTPPPVTDSCDVSWKFFYDTYDIRGKNFDATKLGNNGDGFKGQLKGCGLITFHFEQTPTDPTFAWYANGRTSANQKDCIGHALQSAGGAYTSNCHGPG